MILGLGRRRRPVRDRRWPDRRSGWRWVLAGLGLVVLVVALIGSAGPFRQTQEFRAAVQCHGGEDACFGDEPGTIVDRDTYTTTSTSGGTNGQPGTTTTTTHYRVTWQRAGGDRESHDVSSAFYGKAEVGQPANLRTWRGEVVGLEVMGATAWFLPESGRSFGYWLYLAHFGLGLLLWGLFFGWWDGPFMMAFRLLAWMFLSFVPVAMITDALTYGLAPGLDLVLYLVFGLLFVGVAGGMLISTLVGRGTG